MLKQIVKSVESVLCDLFDWPTRKTCEALDRMGCAENLKLGHVFRMKYIEMSYEKFIFACNDHSCVPLAREWNAYLNSLGCIPRSKYKVFQVSRKDFIVSNPPGGFIVVPEETASKILALGLP